MKTKLAILVGAALLAMAGLGCERLPMLPTGTPSTTATSRDTVTPLPPTATSTPTLAPTPLPPTATPTSSPTVSPPTVTPPPTALPTDTPTPDWVDLEAQCAALASLDCAEVELLSTAPFYEILATVDLSQPAIEGKQRLRYWNRSTQPLPEIYFRLYPNDATYGGSLRVTSALADGAPVTPHLSAGDTVLSLPLPRPLPPGASVDLELAFHTTVPRDSQVHYQIFTYSREMAALSNFYPALAVYDDEGWDLDPILPQGDAAYTEIAFHQVALIVPVGTVLATSGTEVGRWDNGDGTATHVLVSGPGRDFGLALSGRYEMATRMAGEVAVRSFYLPEDEAAGLKLLGHAADALEILARRFGPYPYNEFDVVQSPIGAGGMELPGMTLIQAEQYGRADGYDEFLVAHEVAHQWWYNLVGNDPQEHAWVDEGLTNYSAIVYFEDLQGRSQEGGTLDWYLRDPYGRLEADQDLPANLPVDAYVDPIYYRIVYAKAGLFFHELRQRLGDAAFFRLLREYADENRYGIVTSEQVLDFWTSRADVDVGDLVERWITTRPPRP